MTDSALLLALLALPLAGARVLLVEDNEINQQVAMEILSGAGLKVTLANNGRRKAPGPVVSSASAMASAAGAISAQWKGAETGSSTGRAWSVVMSPGANRVRSSAAEETRITRSSAKPRRTRTYSRS